jgi:predicted transcriptional regulator
MHVETMTILRRELRETLKIALNKQFPFTCADIWTERGREKRSLNRQLMLFVELGIMERRQLMGYGRPFEYTLTNRELAQSLVDQQPKPKYRAVPKKITPRGVSFVFHMGN